MQFCLHNYAQYGREIRYFDNEVDEAYVIRVTEKIAEHPLVIPESVGYTFQAPNTQGYLLNGNPIETMTTINFEVVSYSDVDVGNDTIEEYYDTVEQYLKEELSEDIDVIYTGFGSVNREYLNQCSQKCRSDYLSGS